ncbi:MULTISPECIES: hypothetical protein [Streptomyces]|uniref:Peptide ABC transporter ATP-binding protein n=2 Tax=Streptomyces TaxID=1883 RepID=A0ABU2RPH9_9ACTN|nr:MULTISPECIES: hypothetical protein [unclassified Streptomyces]MDT0430766.1 hypothetical protein [Streptomyces sp. DSM 41770]
MSASPTSPPRDAPTRRIAVLDGGEVVEPGDREQIMTAPCHPFTV